MKRAKAAKKTKKSPSRRIASKKPDKKKESVAHYTAILVEDLKSDFKFVIESVVNLDKSLNQRIDNFRSEVEERFTRVETVLKHHSDLLEQNEGRWQKNEERWQKNEERWQKNDERLDRIESKLDSVIETVKEHDVVIKRMTA